MIRADQVKVGDRLDLEGDKFADPNGNGVDPSGDYHAFEFELAEVEEIERETPDCIVLYTSLGGFGFPPAHMIKQESDQ